MHVIWAATCFASLKSTCPQAQAEEFYLATILKLGSYQLSF